MARFTEEEIAKIEELSRQGYINITRHPHMPLVIYNYSKIAMFYEKFNGIVEMCRGIICDTHGNIISRPFTKFYNYEEIEDKSIIPDLPFEIYEKLDGSLGILYWWDGTPYIATRGSFVSDQAMHANTLLRTRYAERMRGLDHSKTYLFEIIYPDDMHVVTYGEMDELVLLAIIDTETGEEEDIYSLKDTFIVPKRYDGVSDWLKIRDIVPGDNREGFVIKFKNNFRLKLKYEEYFRLHSMMYGLTEKVILEHIIDGTIQEVRDTIGKFEEEQRIFFTGMIDKYYGIYAEIENDCKEVYREDFPDRKAAAEYFNRQRYPSFLFLMYNHQDYGPAIWKYIWKNRLKYKESKELIDESEDTD